MKKLRNDSEIFGIFESLKGKSEVETSQVNLIYPCALNDLSFSNKDGGNAIYPNMSFEKIRVSIVDFKEVKNPTPELIPHIKHDNAGNQTGGTGSLEIPEVSENPDLKAQMDAGKSVVPKELKKETTWADKKTTEQEKQKDILRSTNSAKEKADKLISEGKLGYGQSGAYVADQVSKEMKVKYGAKWDE